MLHKAFEDTVNLTVSACKTFYVNRLISIAVFGSVGRGTPGPYSDIDMLIIADPLPNGRIKRIEEFNHIEYKIIPWLEHIRNTMGFDICLSPVIKTPSETNAGSPLFLDMIDDAVILVDKNGFFKEYLNRLKTHLKSLKAKKIYNGERWHWNLKQDYQKGDIISI